MAEEYTHDQIIVRCGNVILSCRDGEKTSRDGTGWGRLTWVGDGDRIVSPHHSSTRDRGAGGAEIPSLLTPGLLLSGFLRGKTLRPFV